MPSPLSTRFNRADLPRHNSTAGQNLAIRHSPSAGRALGEKTSQAKKEAAQTNGAKGGRPPGS